MTLPFTDLNGPLGIAVDSVGNLYVVDGGNGPQSAHSRVMKLAAGSAADSELPFTGLREPWAWRWMPVGTSTSPTSSPIRC